MKIWAIIAAILLPPLGVWLNEGVTTAFWVSVVLTLIAFLPGVIFALIVILKPEILPARLRMA